MTNPLGLTDCSSRLVACTMLIRGTPAVYFDRGKNEPRVGVGKFNDVCIFAILMPEVLC